MWLIFTWLKCTWYFRLVVCHIIIVLPLFWLKSGDRRFDIFVVAGGNVRCRYNLRYNRWRRHCRLDDLSFQCATYKIFTPHYTEIFSSLKCTWYFVFLFYYAWISSIPYIIIVILLFSHWKHGIVELAAISSLMASWFVVRQIAVPRLGLSAWRSISVLD